MANIGTLTPFSTDAPQTGQEQSVFDANASGTLGDMPKFVDEFNQSIKDINDLSLSEVGYSQTYLDKDYKERLYTGRKNLLINGGFDVWDYGDIVSVASGYCINRWSVNDIFSSVSLNKTSSRKVNVAEFTIESSVISGVFGLTQSIENAKYYSDSNVTISFSMYSRENSNSPFVEIWVGNQTTLLETKVDTKYFSQAELSWDTHSATITLPSLVYGDIVSIVLRNNHINGNTTSFLYDRIQLEKGSVATPFEILQIAETKELCKYYFRKSDVETRVDEYSYEMRVAPATPIETVAPFSYDAELY